jgi:UDP-N-acetylmuramoylalanine--D-glutamate ligase
MSPFLHDRRVLILGLGASGLAMARWCTRAGARVTVADTRAEPPQRSRLLEDCPGAKWLHAPFDAALLDAAQAELLLLSPGLTPDQTAQIREAAQSRGVWIGGELALFAEALAERAQSEGYTPKILAVTGTNGKTTVTALTGQLLARAGLQTAVAGNIGPTLLDTLRERIEQHALPEVWVLELSSFQLEHAGRFEPTAAAVLNLTQDHLDWHGSMEAYAAAKARIFGSQGVRVLNRDDARVMAMVPPAPAKGAPALRWVSFGSDVPQQPLDWGLETVHDMTWLVRAGAADELPRRRGSAEGESAAAPLLRLMPADALRIRGRHNALNALAALALATEAGAPLAPMLHGLREYRGEPHRVETVAIVDGVEYIDDSKGTNVGATAAAISGLAQGRSLVLILGGLGKGQDFAPLAPLVAQHVRAVVLIGQDAPRIRAALSPAGVELIDAADMPAAVRLAAARARPGDAVLMSPACASMDMFADYAHRAEVFRASVAALAAEAGTPIEGVR